MAASEELRSAARQDLCRLLAACYYEPAAEFEEEKLFDSMHAAAALIHPELAGSARRLGEAFAREGRQNLLVDYARLFLGPMGARAKPYGSAWLEGDGSLMQDSTVEVLDLYREADFEMAKDFHELPDHIAAELEFLYLLLFRENQARQAGDAPAQEGFAQLRRRFLERHLGKWTGPFAAAMRAGAESDFYRELAELTGYFVRMETE